MLIVDGVQYCESAGCEHSEVLYVANGIRIPDWDLISDEESDIDEDFDIDADNSEENCYES